MDDCFVFDWLTCSFSSDSLDVVGLLRMLGMSDVTFTEQQSGSRLRYGHRVSYDGISIHYTDSEDGRHTEGICLEMSGQGCRDFESFGSGDWVTLFRECLSFSGHFTRLDVAFDDFSGVIPLDIMADMARKGLFTSRLHRMQVFYDVPNHLELDHAALTVMHGSRESDICIRFYDKRAERAAWDEFSHWVRAEIQTRSGTASGFIQEYLDRDCLYLGDLFCDVLDNYLAYRCNSPTDQNLRRSPYAPWWQRFVADAAAISIHSKKGVDYNLFRTLGHVDRNHNPIRTAIFAQGLGGFLQSVFDHSEPLPDKYLSMLQKQPDGDKLVQLARSGSSDQFRAAVDSIFSVRDPKTYDSEDNVLI